MLRKNRQGFSLLELLLVLGIIAALVVGAFIVYPKVRAAQQVEVEAKNISTISAGVRALYTGKSNFSGLTDSVALGAKIYPDNMIVGTGTSASIVNSFKGTVMVSSDGETHSGEDDSGFFIKYTRLMPDVCSRLVSAVASSFYEINVNGTYVKENGGSLNMVTLTTACSISGSGNYALFYAE